MLNPQAFRQGSWIPSLLMSSAHLGAQGKQSKVDRVPKLCEIGIARSASDEGHHSCNIIQKPETSPISKKSGLFEQGKQYHRQLQLQYGSDPVPTRWSCWQLPATKLCRCWLPSWLKKIK